MSPFARLSQIYDDELLRVLIDIKATDPCHIAQVSKHFKRIASSDAAWAPRANPPPPGVRQIARRRRSKQTLP